MAKIQVYERSQTLPATRGTAGPLLTPSFRAEDFKSPVGAAFETAAKVAPQIMEQRDKAYKLDMRRKMTEDELSITQEIIDLEKNAPPGAPNHTEGVRAIVNKYRSQTFQDMPSRFEPEFSALYAGIASQHISKGMRFEAQAVGKKQVSDFTTALDNIANTVAANPNAYQSGLQIAESMAEFLPPSMQEEQKKSAAEIVTNSMLQGQQRTIQTLDQAKNYRRLLERPDIQKSMSRQSYETALDFADKQVDKFGNLEERRFIDDLGEINRQIAATGQNPSGMSRETIVNSITDEYTRDKALEQFNHSVNVGAAVNTLKDATGSEALSIVLEAQAAVKTADPLNYDEAVSKANALSSAYNARVQALKDDPVNYINNNNPGIKSLRDQWINSLSDDPDSADANREEYLSTAIKEMERLGLGSGEIKIMTSAETAAVQRSLEGIGADPAGVDKAFQVLASERLKFGKYWRYAQNQLIKEKALTPAQAAASRVMSVGDGLISRNILTAASTPDLKVRIKNEKGIKDADVAKEVFDKMESFLSTVEIEDPTTQANIDAAKTLTQYYILKKDMSVSQAARLAAADLFDNYYDYAGSVRIPKSAGADIPHTRIALEYVKNNLQLYNVVAPPYSGPEDPEEALRLAMDSYADSGQWVMAAGDSGVVYVDAVGRPIQKNVNGKVQPFYFSWSELESIGRQAPVGSLMAGAEIVRTAKPKRPQDIPSAPSESLYERVVPRNP